MNRLLSFFPFFLSVLGIICCSREPFLPGGLETNVHAHNVSIGDVELLTAAMARGTVSATKSSEIKKPEIIPIVDVFRDTIFYAVNFFPGWKLISSDKRTPIVLAENEAGEFSLTNLADGEAVWLECMAQDLRAVKESPDWRMPDAENGLYFEELWASLRPIETKADEAYYGLYSTRTENETFRVVDHLIPVAWTQNDPFNMFCPLKTDGSGRVPAGCVAVAGAQMLYYLHGKIGLPTSAPTSGYCIGTSNSCTQGFSDLSASAWSNMHFTHLGNVIIPGINLPLGDTCSNEALLIGWVGKNVNMDYGDDKSGSTNAKLTRFINNLGIFCQKRSFNGDIATQSLLDSMPIIVGAFGSFGTLNIPNYNIGHTFIIDGFHSYKKRTYRTYVKYNPVECLDSLDEGIVVFEPDLEDYYITISESSPTISRVKMNWGWGENPDNDAWYTLTDSWKAHINNGDSTNFDFGRDMIYNFQSL